MPDGGGASTLFVLAELLRVGHAVPDKEDVGTPGFSGWRGEGLEQRGRLIASPCSQLWLAPRLAVVAAAQLASEATQWMRRQGGLYWMVFDRAFPAREGTFFQAFLADPYWTIG